jgi:hypothetical protein
VVASASAQLGLDLSVDDLARRARCAARCPHRCPTLGGRRLGVGCLRPHARHERDDPRFPSPTGPRP